MDLFVTNESLTDDVQFNHGAIFSFIQSRDSHGPRFQTQAERKIFTHFIHFLDTTHLQSPWKVSANVPAPFYRIKAGIVGNSWQIFFGN